MAKRPALPRDKDKQQKLAKPSRRAKAARKPANKNFAQQGRQGNIRQNTRNQGYQQDR